MLKVILSLQLAFPHKPIKLNGMTLHNHITSVPHFSLLQNEYVKIKSVPSGFSEILAALLAKT